MKILNTQCPEYMGLALGVFFVAISSLGCQETQVPREDLHVQRDSITIVCSKLFENPTYQTYLNRLAPGEVPLRLVNASVLDTKSLDEELQRAGGVVLTGGEDIHPARYGQPQDTVACGFINLTRDALEWKLLEFVQGSGVPCLGICRGFQYMNVFAGGTLDPHLPNAYGDLHRAGVEGDSRDTTHVVLVTSSPSGLPIALGDSGWVISHHHQGIDRLGEGLMVWAEAADGLAEGIQHRDSSKFLFYVGVQWHPERSVWNQTTVEPVGRSFLTAALSFVNSQ